MMAKQHVNFGLGVYNTSVLALSQEWSIGGLDGPMWLDGWKGAEPLILLISNLVVALFLLWPDIDHHNSTITLKLGWMGKVLQKAASFLGGGHRKGAHSLLFVAITGAAFYLLTTTADLAPFVPWVVAAIALFSGSVTAKFFLPRSWVKSRGALYLVIAGLVAYVFITDPAPLDGYWLPIAAAFGTLFHDVGDILTKGKVYVLHPFSSWTPQLPFFLRFPTGGWFESVVLNKVFRAWAMVALTLAAVIPLAV